MKKTYLSLAFALFLLGSCGPALQYQMINSDMSLVSLGMSKEEVYKKIGKPNNTIAARRTDEGPVEVLEYLRRETNSYTEKTVQRPICVYFLNNELIEWGPGEDWQVDQARVDQIIERNKKK
jgi:hypothetical protein